MIARLALAAGLLLAGGCAAVAPPPPPSAAALEERRLALQASAAWRLAGRVAVTAGSEGGSAALDWRQAGERSELVLRGPFGAGSLRVALSGGSVELDDGTHRLEGEPAREFLERQLGAPLPLAGLRYWVLGVPAPGAPYVEVTGPDGLPGQLDQQGWQVGFERYREVDGRQLPGRVTARTAGARVRLVISGFEFGP